MKSPVTYLWARRIWLFAAAMIACLALAARGVGNSAARTAALSAFSSAPLCFEANAGQTHDGAQFIARGVECSVLLSPDAAEIIVGKGSDKTAVPAARASARSVRLQLVGANPAAKMTGLDRMTATANYFVGNDPSKWLAGVPLFSRVQAEDVYPGVRVVYYASRSAQLEYDFLLPAGALPGQIRFRVEGVDDLHVDAAGNLVLKLDGEEISEHEPVAYQDVNGTRRQIDAAYRLNEDGTVGFALGDYDHSRPLVIDPVLDFLTYLGGKRMDLGWAIALYGSNIYVAGETMSKQTPNNRPVLFPPTNNPIVFPENGTNRVFDSYQGGSGAFGDAFVASYTTNGSLNYFSYLGGRRDDGALAIAAQTDGSVWVTGFTDSTNFPLVNPIRATITGPINNALAIPPADVFLSHISASGTSLLFSTFFGGEEVDEGTGIVLDGNNDVFITGLTSSSNLPVTLDAFQPTNAGFFDAFVAEFSASGTISNAYTNTYTTYFGATNTEYGLSIALDSGGNAWITGVTFSTNFLTTNLTQLTNLFLAQMSNHTANSIETNHLFSNLNSQTNSPHHNTSFESDAFVAEFSPMGTNLLFSTLLGGSNSDAGVHLAIDSANNVFVTGYTLSPDFPTNVVTTVPFTNFTAQFPNLTTNIFPNATSNIISHAFVTEFSPSVTYEYTTNEIEEGTNEVMNIVTNAVTSYIIGASTSLGGNGADRGTGIGLDANGNVYVIGSAGSTNFFETNVVILTNSIPGPTNTNRHHVITNYIGMGILTNNFTFTNLTSTNFAGRLRRSGSNTNDLFIAVLSPGLTNYLQSIILGGPGDNEPNGIAVDPTGSAVYFVGSTTSRTNFATTNAQQRIFGGGGQPDAFIGRMSLP